MTGTIAKLLSGSGGEVDDAAIVAALDRSQAIIRFAPDGTIRDANENFLRAVGARHEDVVGQHHSIFVPSNIARSQEYRQFWNDLGRGQYQHGCFERVARDGSVVWLQASYNPVRGKNGRVREVVKFASDVTEDTLKAADHTGQVEAINRTLAVIHFDTEGNVLWANDLFLDACGYRLDELKGRHHSALVPDEIVESAAYKSFWRGLSQGEFQKGEFRRVAKDGSEIWLDASYSPIIGPDGNVMKVVKYANDATATIKRRQKRKEVGDQVDQNLARIVESVDNADKRVKEAAEAAGDTVDTVQSVASAAQQFETSAKEISQNTSAARDEAQNARREAEDANAKTEDLTSAADSMTEVVQLIRSISEQINMLALNATIEAARAGEAGQGFAVVAQEVKDLASQSSQATERISKEISRAQNTTSEVIKKLSSIRQAVETVENGISTVAGAIEQQTSSSQEMASNVTKASSAVEQIKSNLDNITEAVSNANQLAKEGNEAYRELEKDM